MVRLTYREWRKSPEEVFRGVQAGYCVASISSSDRCSAASEMAFLNQNRIVDFFKGFGFCADRDRVVWLMFGIFYLRWIAGVNGVNGAGNRAAR